jgi:hypothetical protein
MLQENELREIRTKYPDIKFVVEEPQWLIAQKEDIREFPSSQVYFIAAARSAIKIGISNSPETRLTELQTAHYEKLVLLGTMPGHLKTEWYLHHHFAEERLQREWFRPSSRLLSFVKDNRIQRHIRRD